MDRMVDDAEGHIKALVDKIRLNQERINKLRGAAREGGAVDGDVRFVARDSVMALSDEDLAAMAAYLSTLR